MSNAAFYDEQGESLILKGVLRCADRGYVELVMIGTPTTNEPSIHSRSVQFLGLKSQHLQSAARTSGAKDVTLFGNHQNQPYDSGSSTDLIMVATKGEIK